MIKQSKQFIRIRWPLQFYLLTKNNFRKSKGEKNRGKKTKKGGLSIKNKRITQNTTIETPKINKKYQTLLPIIVPPQIQNKLTQINKIKLIQELFNQLSQVLKRSVKNRFTKRSILKMCNPLRFLDKKKKLINQKFRISYHIKTTLDDNQIQ